jgi:PIN domain nuclease of toxin-antitoxin system
MKLLLDTHIWIWTVGKSDRLSPRVARALTNQANEFWLSPVSVWEVFMLLGKGRLQIPEGFTTWITRALTAMPIQEAPLTFEVAQALPMIDLSHADPADQLLAATAKVFDLTLVTADEKLMHAPGIKVLANR